MPAVRAFATAALLAVILVTGVSPANAAPPEGGVVIETIPKVPGLRITLDSETVITDKSGIAQFQTGDRQSLSERVKLDDQKVQLGGREVRVKASRTYVTGKGLRIAMDIFWPVRFSFLDVNGEPIDVGRIESVQLKSTTGETREASAEEIVWLHGKRAVSLAGGLAEKKIQWAIQAVEYASSSVVNSAQQRFEPANTQAVEIELLFYRSRVTVKDAFFGFGVGDAVLVTSPDGRVDRFSLGDNSTVDLPSLPRGDYSIAVDGAGPRMTRPVAISRDQVLDLKFYSWLDIGLVVAFLAAFAVGTLWFGWRSRRAHRLAVEDDSERQPDPEREATASPTESPATPASAASASSTPASWQPVATAGPPQPERDSGTTANRRAGDRGGI
jgi:hypothetical protein